MGGVSSAADAVRRFPGPPLEDPPTSPPRPSTGVVGGARWDDRRTGCPHGRRSVATDVPARLAQRLQRRRPQVTSSGGSAAGVTPREPQASDWRDGRAAASSSGAARPRGWRVPGVAIWSATREAQSGRPACSPSGPVHAQREGNRPAVPGHGRAAPREQPTCTMRDLSAQQRTMLRTSCSRRAARSWAARPRCHSDAASASASRSRRTR